MDEHEVLTRLAALQIETPSWGYGNSGTRFHVYPWPGAARTVHERIADAALVHRLTGCCPSVALHIPWDAVTPRGIRLLNPGSPTDRRRQPVCTMMTAVADAGELRDVELVPVER